MGKHDLLKIISQKEFEEFLRRLSDQVAKKIAKKIRFALRQCPYCEKPLGFGTDTVRIRRGVIAHFSCFEEADKRDEAAMFANELPYPSTPIDCWIERELAEEAAEVKGDKQGKVIPIRRAS